MKKFIPPVAGKYARRLIQLFVFVAIISFRFPEGKKLSVYMIGDSTMCPYDITRFPQMGWGMPFANYFDSTVTVDNRAKGGRSTKSFMDENLWQPIVDQLKEGDYVLIQFGHNDAANSKDHPNRYASPEDYKKNLVKYVTDTRNKKANPVLITPVTRRKFDSAGMVVASHAPYSKMVAAVAEEYNVPMIDLDGKSRQLVQDMGPECSRYLYMDFEAGENPIFPAGYHDNTHFNEFGARQMAWIVLREIAAQKLSLADHMLKPRTLSR